jgi:hypothetical protein
MAKWVNRGLPMDAGAILIPDSRCLMPVNETRILPKSRFVVRHQETGVRNQGLFLAYRVAPTPILPK